MNLILIAPDDLGSQGLATLRDARAVHLCQVLGAQPGRVVRIGMVDGPRGEGTVIAAAPGHVTLQCRFEDAMPPVPAVDLVLAVPRPKVLRRLWAQLASIGVGRIVLTNAARVERNYFDTHVLGEPFYRPLLLEGLQQARDTRVPVVSVHRQFRKLVEDDLDALCPQRVRLVADPGDAPSPRDAAYVGAAFRRPDGGPAGRAATDARVLLAIGPEGGWNAFERELLQARGFERVSIGARPLRTDTACVALLSLVHDGLAARLSCEPPTQAPT